MASETLKKHDKSISNSSSSSSSNGGNGYIKRLLKTYLESADRSLSGPDRATRAAAAGKPAVASAADNSSASAASKEPASSSTPASSTSSSSSSSSPVKSLNKNWAASPAKAAYRLPVFLPKDTSLTSQRKAETSVCGKMVACFDVGGEKRICVPDLINTVLHDITIDDINAACDKLCVHCSQCSDEQMLALKSAGVLPAETLSAGLMTKSQAERLCRYVFEQKYGAGPSGYTAHRMETSRAARGLSFMVYHECFGKCKGVFYESSYTQPAAACIECCECSCLMSPEQFVCHSHHGQELRTCHWGFDASHWRSYLLVARDHREDIGPLQAHLEELKVRFRNKENPTTNNGQSEPAILTTPPTLTSGLKRKDVMQTENGASVVKRTRLDSTSSSSAPGGAAGVLKTLAQHLPPYHHSTRDASKISSCTSARSGIPAHPYYPFDQHHHRQHHREEDEEDRREAGGDVQTRRSLVTMLQLATRGDSVPAVTRHKLTDNILAMFDQRSQLMAHLVQENAYLTNRLQQVVSAQARYRTARDDLESADCLADLTLPRHTTAAVSASSSSASSFASHATAFTYPSVSRDRSSAALLNCYYKPLNTEINCK